MVLITKTLAQFVSEVEDGTIQDILAAIKKGGADRAIVVVRVKTLADNATGLEVYDVGP